MDARHEGGAAKDEDGDNASSHAGTFILLLLVNARLDQKVARPASASVAFITGDG